MSWDEVQYQRAGGEASSLCNLRVLCVSVVKKSAANTITETHREPGGYREELAWTLELRTMASLIADDSVLRGRLQASGVVIERVVSGRCGGRVRCLTLHESLDSS